MCLPGTKEMLEIVDAPKDQYEIDCEETQWTRLLMALKHDGVLSENTILELIYPSQETIEAARQFNGLG